MMNETTQPESRTPRGKATAFLIASVLAMCGSAFCCDLSSLSDIFDVVELDISWSVLHPELANVFVEDGKLHVVPTVSGHDVTWVNNAEGPLVYKEVTGDFTVTAAAHMFDPKNPMNPPPTSWRLGGITVRDPVAPPGQHNWLHVVIGAGVPNIPMAAETKTTIDSVSSLELFPIASTEAELQVSRNGSQFLLSYRELGAPDWQLLGTFDRPDLPATVQVGLSASSFSPNGSPSLVGAFDYIAFSGPCVGDVDGDGIVGILDFLMLLADWGPCDQPCPPSCAADFDDDCTVGITDFLMLLANWTA